MSRPLEFRAWDEKTKRMVYFGRLRACACESVLHLEADVDLFNEDPQSEANIDLGDLGTETFGEHPPLMQYTGIKDLHDKEVYEGDILSFGLDTDDLETEWVQYQVAWCEAHLCWEVGPPEMHYHLCNFADEGELSGTVAGNIYEHPELLERSNE